MSSENFNPLMAKLMVSVADFVITQAMAKGEEIPQDLIDNRTEVRRAEVAKANDLASD